jgi:putative flippase GtrA
MIVVREYLLGREFRRFVVVGGIGFCVDGGLLTILMRYGWDVILARSCSFLLAVSSTWLLNRLWTFDSGKLIGLRREYAYYFSAQVLGAMINLSIFFILISLYPAFRETPLIPLAFGAAVSLGFNYMVSKSIVFKR